MRGMLFRIIAVCLGTVLLLGAAGCGGGQEAATAPAVDASGDGAAPAADTAADGGAVRIALITKTMSNPYFITMGEAAGEKAEALGIELLWQAAEKESDVEKQMQIMENMVAQQVDAIIVTPSGAMELVPVIKKANDAGIPVIIVDEKVDPETLAAADAYVDTTIASDNYMGGELAAEALYEALGGTGKVAVLEGVAGHEVSNSRCGGFVDKTAALGGLDLVAMQPANWEQEQGYSVFQNMIQANPDIAGLFCASDLMALGAVKALEDAGKGGEVIVIGFDANDDARTAVTEGRMLGSVAQFPDKMAEIAVESAMTILEGGTVEAEIPVEIQLLRAEDL